MIISFKTHKNRKELKLIDEVIYSMIKNKTEEHGGFNLKDEEITSLLKITRGTLHNSFNKLKALGMIYTYSKEKGVRILKHLEVSDAQKQ